MDEKRTELEKQHQKRMRRLMLCTLLPDIAAFVLVALGVRQQRAGGSGVLMFVSFLLLTAVSAAWIIGVRRLASIRQEALDALEAEYGADPDADESLLHLPGDGETASLLVMGYPSDTVYQLIAGEREYHFVRLGWGGLDAKSFERILPPGLSDEQIRGEMEKGISVPKADVESVEVTMKNCVSTQLPNDGIFTLRAGGKRRKFILLRPGEPTTPEAVRAFFTDVSDRLTMDTAGYEKAEAIREEIRELTDEPDEQPDPAMIKKLRPLAIALGVLPWLCFAVWRFLDVPYLPFAALQVVLALAPVALTIALPKYFSLNSVTKLSAHDPEVRPGTIDMFYTIMASMFPLTLSGLVDFNIQGWIPLLIATAVFCAVLALLLTRNGKGIRRVWLVRLLLTLVLMMFSSGIVIETNYLLDRSEPQAVALPIQDKHISSGRTTSYVLEFSQDGEEFTLDVDPQLYDQVSPGDTVYVVTNRGGLGIEYATVWTEDEWNQY